MILDRISNNIAPQMKIVNMVIPILMHICILVSNWSIASGIKSHVIQRNVTESMSSNYVPQYVAGYCNILSQIFMLSNQTSSY